MESASYIFSFEGDGVFYLVTTGWIFAISLLCENSIIQPNTFDCGKNKLLCVASAVGSQGRKPEVGLVRMTTIDLSSSNFYYRARVNHGHYHEGTRFRPHLYFFI